MRRYFKPLSGLEISDLEPGPQQRAIRRVCGGLDIDISVSLVLEAASGGASEDGRMWI